ncbi:hypothetical protein Bpfe_030526 [Biomphalaria pfeifferi]|uniref:Uncharacterized protein n=1 Tax=Biomphalaria pfeifferi TaxID=112525 RepID=A0AAD8AR40_BIOPF|nr:hypothetical protein Bpfe_030526 [Biomphalaria pfeifferi]
MIEYDRFPPDGTNTHKRLLPRFSQGRSPLSQEPWRTEGGRFLCPRANALGEEDREKEHVERGQYMDERDGYG